MLEIKERIGKMKKFILDCCYSVLNMLGRSQFYLYIKYISIKTQHVSGGGQYLLEPFMV